MSDERYEPISKPVPLRTYIATEAMAGLLANDQLTRAMASAAQSEGKKTMAGLAALAVYAADALIAELNK